MEVSGDQQHFSKMSFYVQQKKEIRTTPLKTEKILGS